MNTWRVPSARTISGAYRLPAMVWAFGLPRYTADRRAAVLTKTAPSRSATASKASSQRGLGQLAVAADQRPRQPVGIVVELGEAGALRADEPLAEDVVAVAAGAGHPAVLDGERQAAGGLAQGADPQGSAGMAASCADVRLLVDLGVQRADVGQVAVTLGVVQAVADDELVGDVEADVGDVDVGAHGVGLAQQRAHPQRPRMPGREVAQQPGQRQPGVDDVLDDQHVAVVDVAVEVLEDPHHARRRRRRAVGADRHELQLRGQRDRPGQVGDEHDRALEHGDQQQVLAVCAMVSR